MWWSRVWIDAHTESNRIMVLWNVDCFLVFVVRNKNIGCSFFNKQLGYKCLTVFLSRECKCPIIHTCCWSCWCTCLADVSTRSSSTSGVVLHIDLPRIRMRGCFFVWNKCSRSDRFVDIWQIKKFSERGANTNMSSMAYAHLFWWLLPNFIYGSFFFFLRSWRLHFKLDVLCKVTRLSSLHSSACKIGLYVVEPQRLFVSIIGVSFLPLSTEDSYSFSCFGVYNSN